MPADRLLHPKLGHSEKVSQLSDLEYRVWTTYLLASDDYGVMRLSAVTVQAASDALARRKTALVQAALERLVTLELVLVFEHQGRRYCFQSTWQNFQRVKHPRDTMQPAPSLDELAHCTPATRKLFTLNHPFFRTNSEDASEELEKDFGNSSEILPQEISEVGSLARARTHETANGKRLMANGYRGGVGEAPLDVWARELVNLYPPQGRCGWHLVERPLFEAIGDDPHAGWEALRATLERHKRSHQWRVKQMVPRLDKWLREGLYLQELPETPVSTLVNEKTERALTSAADFVRGGDRGAA